MKSTALGKLEKVLSSFDNIYEISVIIAKRAKQVLDNRKESFETELDSIGVTGHLDEGPMNKDNWQEAVYKKYEKNPKPIIAAIEDLATNKISYHYLKNE